MWVLTEWKMTKMITKRKLRRACWSLSYHGWFLLLVLTIRQAHNLKEKSHLLSGSLSRGNLLMEKKQMKLVSVITYLCPYNKIACILFYSILK